MDESIVSFLEVKEPAKVLKLSEAIRIGARIRPQGFHGIFRQGRSCALGAAYEGKTGRVNEDIGYQEIWTEFPGLYGACEGKEKLTDVVWRKNDVEKLSREQIADWLESKGY